MAVSQRSGDVAVFGGGDFVKSLDVNQVYEGFWRKPAYRVPDNDCACIDSGTTPTATRPIGRFNVRSFITSVPDGARSSARSVGLHHHFISPLLTLAPISSATIRPAAGYADFIASISTAEFSAFANSDSKRIR